MARDAVRYIRAPLLGREFAHVSMRCGWNVQAEVTVRQNTTSGDRASESRGYAWGRPPRRGGLLESHMSFYFIRSRQSVCSPACWSTCIAIMNICDNAGLQPVSEAQIPRGMEAIQGSRLGKR